MAISQIFSAELFPRFRNYTILLAALIAGGGYMMGDGGEPSGAVINDDGSITIGSKTIYQSVYPTSENWFDAEAEVTDGSTIRVLVSGTYWDEDTQSRIGVLGNGEDHAQLPHISQKAKHGQLLMQVTESGFRPTAKPKSSEVYVLKEGWNKITAKKTGDLYFSVNEKSYDPYNQSDWEQYKADTGDSLGLIDFQTKKPEPFFEDNIGHLILKIIVEE